MDDEDRTPVTLSEIYNQADACQRTVERIRERNRIFDAFLPLDNFTDIIITGCGSSLHLAMCASFAWSEMLERPVLAAASSELAHFPEHYLKRGSRPLVIAISRSGGTTEVKLAVEKMKQEYGAQALAVIGDRGDVGTACDAEIVFAECREKSVVMTQAFTCILLGLYAMADYASGSRRFDEISAIPRLIDAAFKSSEKATRELAEDPSVARFFVLGSGPMKGLADECALKLTEMSLDTALSFRTLEFRHGPKATLGSGDQVLVFPVAAERQYLDTLLAEINATGARTMLIGDERDAVPGSDGAHVLSVEAPSQECLRPALYAHVGQLLGYWRAAARDLNPDAPRHLARTVLLDA